MNFEMGFRFLGTKTLITLLKTALSYAVVQTKRGSQNEYLLLNRNYILQQYTIIKKKLNHEKCSNDSALLNSHQKDFIQSKNKNEKKDSLP
jgi:hypothetical protein